MRQTIETIDYGYVPVIKNLEWVDDKIFDIVDMSDGTSYIIKQTLTDHAFVAIKIEDNQ